jgi:N-acetylglutamate synthase-like GNAT family acetyltransferase
MQPHGFTVRRATVDDLPALKVLWGAAGLPVVEEERHLTEFQVLQDGSGNLLGAAGLQVAGKAGRLHSEVFAHPELEDQHRPVLWERLRTVARNHGLSRIWTLEDAPYWHIEAGFAPAPPEQFKKFPVPFGNPHAPWKTLALVDESQELVSLEKEFELFQQQQMQATDQMMQQARQLKLLAYLVLGIALIVGAYMIYSLLTRGPSLLDLMRR